MRAGWRVFLVTAGWLLLINMRTAVAVERSETRLLMGTSVQLMAQADDDALLSRAMEAAFREMNRLSDMMNHYDPRSVASEINREAGVRPVSVPRELMEVLRAARRASELSEGAFDITVAGLKGWRFYQDDPRLPSAVDIRAQLPLVNYRDVVLDGEADTVWLRRADMRMDLGGIAKLYILHAGMEVLRRHGIRSAMINGGGDVEVMGGRDGRPWRVGIRHPRRADALLGAVELTDGFVASSGDYERYFIREGRRYHHILDPRTGYPADSPQHVTLVGRELDAVNGLGVSIMVRGPAWGRALLARRPEVEALIVERDATLWTSPGLARRYRYTAAP
jgi:thiamine biosynthesis lipoprotein